MNPPMESLVEDYEQPDRPNKHVWNMAGYVYAKSNFLVFHNHNNLPLGPLLLFPYTQELHDPPMPTRIALIKSTKGRKVHLQFQYFCVR